jgi:hypothetical protein
MRRPRIGGRNCSISAQIFSGVLAFFTRLRQIQITAMTAMLLDDGVPVLLGASLGYDGRLSPQSALEARSGRVA